MLAKYKLPILAVIGFLFALYFVFKSNKPAQIALPVAEPAQTGFKNYIAGSGLIEAQSENISIGTPLSGVVSNVAVAVGSRVKAGDVLFTLEGRDVQAELSIRRADIAEAQANLQDAQNQLQRVAQVPDQRAVSAEELDRRRIAVNLAKARLDNVQAQAQATQVHLDRLVVRAPINGEVLQVNVRSGEYAQASVLATPLLLLGNLGKLHVRVDIDENDAWRFKSSAAAQGFLRGNRNAGTELKFVRVEPFVVPKISLTGDSTERVDTRVLQVIYSFDRAQLPAYVGQQMDIFIDDLRPVKTEPAEPVISGAVSGKS
ncbi:MAG TPA: efflux RND transporter periplasmic adaptor subunit [Gallionella sp.]|nr:efflux RND transporter periplasmic adaptor subunit [Gallionella sp.]